MRLYLMGIIKVVFIGFLYMQGAHAVAVYCPKVDTLKAVNDYTLSANDSTSSEDDDLTSRQAFTRYSGETTGKVFSARGNTDRNQHPFRLFSARKNKNDKSLICSYEMIGGGLLSLYIYPTESYDPYVNCEEAKADKYFECKTE